MHESLIIIHKSQKVICSMNVDTELLTARRTLCGHDWGGAGMNAIVSPFTRLYWLVSGESVVRHHGREYHLIPGSLYIIPGHSPGYYVCPKSMELLWCHFTAGILSGMDLFEMFTCDYEIGVPPGERPGIHKLWHRMIDLSTQSGVAARFEADAILRTFLARFLRTIDAKVETARGSVYERLRPALEHIDRNIGQQIQLGQLARVMNLQPTYFSNMFAKHLGLPPKKYILWRKVRKAQSLLRATPLPVKEIAGKVGFGNEFHFSRVFKRLTGTAPSEFRSRADFE